MRVRCLHCHDPIELDDAAGLDSVSCPTCGESFRLVGDDTLPLPPEAAESHRVTARKLGRFELLQQLGKGGYGTVWLARDPELDRLVAVKVPRTSFLSAEETEQFLREARAAAQLHHPNIVSVHEIGRDGDTVFIVSDYVRGQTLSDRLTAQRMSAREAVQMTLKIAEALDHAHEKGVIHRDLKPGNIMVAQSLPSTLSEGVAPPARAAANDLPEPCIMDFGLARRDAGEMTMTVQGQVLGTPLYMSPEQARGESHQADRRSDIYSLGVILYAMLTGELPFHGNASMLAYKIQNEEPPSLRRLDNHVPRDLETICLKCMHKSPDRRYQRASLLAADLRRWLNHEPIHARPVGRLERTWRWSRRKPWAAAALLALLALLVTMSVSVWSLARANARTRAALRQSHLDRAGTLLETAEPRRRSQAITEVEFAAGIAPGLDARNLYIRCLDLAELQPREGLAAQHWLGEGFAAFRGGDTGVLVVSRGARPAELDILTGEEIRAFKAMPEFDRPAAVSPDGRSFAAVRADGTRTELWDLASERMLGSLSDTDGRALIPTSIAFSQRGDLLALAVAEKEDLYRIAIYSVAPLEEVHSWTVEAQLIDCLRFGPHANVLAASIGDLNETQQHTVGLWHVQDGKQLATLALDSEFAHATQYHKPNRIDFSPDGRLLAAAGGDGSVKLWDLREVVAGNRAPPKGADAAMALEAHGSEALVAQFSPDGRWLATSGKEAASDGWLKVWDAESGLPVARARFATDPADTLNLQWSASGRYAFCQTGKRLLAWHFTPPLSRTFWLRQPTTTPDSVSRLQFGPQERWLACALNSLDAVPLIDLRHPDAPCRYLESGYAGPRLVFSPNGDRLWKATDSGYESWDLASLKRLEPIADDNERLWALAINDAGHRIVAATDTADELIVRNLDTGHQLRSLGVQDNGLKRLSGNDCWLSQDGGYALLFERGRREADATLQLVELAKEGKLFSTKASPVYCVALANEAKLLAIGQLESILVYNPRTDRLIAKLQGPEDHVSSLAFSRSGDLLASVCSRDATARLWNPSTGELLATFQTGQMTPEQIALSPSGRWLATGDQQGQVRLWDLRELRRHLNAARLDWPAARFTK